MKTLFIAFIAVFGYFPIGAQIKTEALAKKTVIGETRQGNRLIASLYYLSDGTDSLGVLMYRNREYEAIIDIRQIEFLLVPGLVDSLYSIVRFVLSTGQDAALTLGDTFVKVTRPKGFGGAIRIGTGEGFFYLTAKQLEKLFGK